MQNKIFILILFLCLCACEDTKIDLKKEVFVLEYGETISFDPTYYLKNKELYREGMKVIINDLYEKTIAELGEYQGYIQYNKIKKPFTIQIKDTSFPEFTHFEEYIELPMHSDAKDVLKNFKAVDEYADMQEETFVWIEGFIDFYKPGIYEVEICTQDKHKNVSFKKCIVAIQSYDTNKDQKTIHESVDEKYEEEKQEVTEDKQEEEDNKIQQVEYTLPKTYQDETKAYHMFFWTEAEAYAMFLQKKDARYHLCYFDDYETYYYELIWWEEE